MMDVVGELNKTFDETANQYPDDVDFDLPVFQYLLRRRCCVECWVVMEKDSERIQLKDWCGHRRCHELSYDPQGDFSSNRHVWKDNPVKRIVRGIESTLKWPSPGRWIHGVTPRVWTVHLKPNWRDRSDLVMAQLLNGGEQFDWLSDRFEDSHCDCGDCGPDAELPRLARECVASWVHQRRLWAAKDMEMWSGRA